MREILITVGRGLSPPIAAGRDIDPTRHVYNSLYDINIPVCIKLLTFETGLIPRLAMVISINLETAVDRYKTS